MRAIACCRLEGDEEGDVDEEVDGRGEDEGDGDTNKIKTNKCKCRATCTSASARARAMRSIVGKGACASSRDDQHLPLQFRRNGWSAIRHGRVLLLEQTLNCTIAASRSQGQGTRCMNLPPQGRQAGAMGVQVHGQICLPARLRKRYCQHICVELLAEKGVRNQLLPESFRDRVCGGAADNCSLLFYIRRMAFKMVSTGQRRGGPGGGGGSGSNVSEAVWIMSAQLLPANGGGGAQRGKLGRGVRGWTTDGD
jgi:hypothetical protein